MMVFLLPQRYLRTEYDGKQRHTTVHVSIRTMSHRLCESILSVFQIRSAVYNPPCRNVQIYNRRNVKCHTANVC